MRARLHAAAEAHAAALREATEAHAELRRLGQRNEMASAAALRAEALLALGRPAEARTAAGEAPLAARARVLGALRDPGAAAALRELDAALAAALREGAVETQLELRAAGAEARLRLGQPDAREALLAAARDANARGFALLAERARAAARQ
jgi:hypothetical protein